MPLSPPPAAITGGAAALAPTAVSGLLYYDPHLLAGSDGDAIASLPNSGLGTGDAAVQATANAKPLLKTGSNGINGRSVLLLDGSNDYMATTTGGAGLSSDWYMGVVCKFSSITGYQSILSFGDATQDTRRTLMKYGTGAGADHALSFIGQISAVLSSYAIANATVYFLEMEYSGGLITLSVNGVAVAKTPPSEAITSYSSTALIFGANPSHSEPFAGSLGASFWKGAIPTAALRSQIHAWVASNYALTINQSVPAARFTATNTLAEAAVVDDGTYAAVGGVGPIMTGGAYTTGSALWGTGAKWSVYGSLAALTTSGEHLFSSSWVNNVGAVWNRSSSGFSCWRYLDYRGYEKGAFGHAPSGVGVWGGPNGSMFIEFSNAYDTSKPGDLRYSQAKGNTVYIRERIRDDTYAHEEYDLTFTEPSVSGATPGLVSLRGKPVTAVANAGVLDTNITTPNFGMLIVKDTTNSKVALYRVESTTLTAIGTLDAEFTTTKDTSSKVNVYSESSVIKVQNNSGGSLNLTAAFYGA